MDEEDGYHDDNSGLWEADMDSEVSDLEELEVQLYSQLHYQTEETGTIIFDPSTISWIPHGAWPSVNNVVGLNPG